MSERPKGEMQDIDPHSAEARRKVEEEVDRLYKEGILMSDEDKERLFEVYRNRLASPGMNFEIVSVADYIEDGETGITGKDLINRMKANGDEFLTREELEALGFKFDRHGTGESQEEVQRKLGESDDE